MNYIIKYPGSTLLYVFALLICVILAAYTIRMDRRPRTGLLIKMSISCIIIILSLIAGLRSVYVGLDTNHYVYNIFASIKNGNMSIVYTPFLFNWIVKIVLGLTDSYTVLLLLFAFITNSLIILRLWDYRKISSFPFMIFAYIAIYYSGTFNIFRQMLAVALVFYGTRYLYKRRYRWYFILITVATFIHTVAILGLVYFLIDFFYTIKNTKLQKYKIIFMLLVPVVVGVGYILISNYFDFSRYIAAYKFYYNISWGWLTPLQILLMFLAYGNMRRLGIHTENSKQGELSDINYKKVSFYYSIGLLFKLTNYIAYLAGRTGLFFQMYEPVFMGYKYYKHKTSLYLIRTVHFIIALYIFYVALAGNGDGIMPYVPFWR